MNCFSVEVTFSQYMN